MGDSNFGKTHTASQFHDATNALHRRRAARRSDEEPPKVASDLAAEGEPRVTESDETSDRQAATRRRPT